MRITSILIAVTFAMTCSCVRSRICKCTTTDMSTGTTSSNNISIDGTDFMEPTTKKKQKTECEVHESSNGYSSTTCQLEN